jgi:hypothetical protein
MKKTLLIAAAALAAGVISSQAQVYSQNIVGYVNQVVPVNFSVINNPLDNSVGNAATNLFDCFSGNNDGTILYYWNGTGFTQVAFASGSPSGFVNAATAAVVPTPILNPGTGYYINNQNFAFTNTFVGTVHVDGAGVSTNVVGVTTNSIGTLHTYVFISSKLPVGGGISSALGLSNDSNGDLDGSIVYIPNIGVDGQVHGYNQVAYSSGSPSGFVNAATAAVVPEPQIPVGGGFLFNNQSGGTWNWIQSF